MTLSIKNYIKHSHKQLLATTTDKKITDSTQSKCESASFSYDRLTVAKQRRIFRIAHDPHKFWT